MCCDPWIYPFITISSNRSYGLSVMILILLFMSELLTDNNAFLSNQILHAITLFGNIGGDGPSLVLVLALGVHVVRFAVVVFASSLAGSRGPGGHPLEANE